MIEIANCIRWQSLFANHNRIHARLKKIAPKKVVTRHFKILLLNKSSTWKLHIPILFSVIYICWTSDNKATYINFTQTSGAELFDLNFLDVWVLTFKYPNKINLNANKDCHREITALVNIKQILKECYVSVALIYVHINL